MTAPTTARRCPLCSGLISGIFHQEPERHYIHCPQCDLVSVPPEFHPPPATEKSRYMLHCHSLSDPGYRNFLNRLFMPLKNKLHPGDCGLDFGCGQAPTLSVLFKEAGYTCADYDLYFARHPKILGKQYDFLVCSETIEHFRNPCGEFENLLGLVRPGGWIGIMTQLRDSASPFGKWFYKNDVTHLCFFSKKVFGWLGEKYGLHTELHHPDSVVLFQLPGT